MFFHFNLFGIILYPRREKYSNLKKLVVPKKKDLGHKLKNTLRNFSPPNPSDISNNFLDSVKIRLTVTLPQDILLSVGKQEDEFAISRQQGRNRINPFLLGCRLQFSISRQSGKTQV